MDDAGKRCQEDPAIVAARIAKAKAEEMAKMLAAEVALTEVRETMADEDEDGQDRKLSVAKPGEVINIIKEEQEEEEKQDDEDANV